MWVAEDVSFLHLESEFGAYVLKLGFAGVSEFERRLELEDFAGGKLAEGGENVFVTVGILALDKGAFAGAAVVYYD